MFFGLIESVWSAQQADVAFLFMTPHESDRLNKDEFPLIPPQRPWPPTGAMPQPSCSSASSHSSTRQLVNEQRGWSPAPHRTAARWQLQPRKCHEFETDHGDIVVRQPRKPRSHKINMSRTARSYISCASLTGRLGASGGRGFVRTTAADGRIRSDSFSALARSAWLKADHAGEDRN